MQPEPPPGANADEVYAWWRSLSQDERDQLIAEHPPKLGNLNGIPAHVRDQINTAVLNDDLNRADDDVRRRNAEQVKRGLDHDRGADPGNQRPVMLWAYEPLAFDGQGRAAIAIGDPDHADDIAVVVPGSRQQRRERLVGRRAQRRDQPVRPVEGRLSRRRPIGDRVDGLRHAGRLQRPAGRVAVAGARGRRAAGAGCQRAGSNARGSGPPHVTVLGHSYGSTTVADAFAGSGAHANDVILLGSPGTDLAHSAKDFHLDGGNVYVGSASSDPVSWLGEAGGVPNGLNEALGYPFGRYAGLGTDPAGGGFGSVRFKAEVPGDDGLSFRNHSHYYDFGGEALRGMAHVVTGHSGALARDNLLAKGRRQPHITTPSKVGPINLPHIDTRIPGIPAYIDPEAERPREGAS